MQTDSQQTQSNNFKNHKHMIVMEQVAMYMAALPCPPLPLVIQQQEGHEECYKNSHDLIANLLLVVMMHQDAKLNEMRKAKQMDLTRQLLLNLRKAGENLDKAYTAFSEFTAGYICAFANIDVSVHFMPMDHVMKNDSVHKACCSWHKAQEMILHKAKGKEDEQQSLILKSDVSNFSYQELLMLHCKRFVA